MSPWQTSCLSDSTWHHTDREIINRKGAGPPPSSNPSGYRQSSGIQRWAPAGHLLCIWLRRRLCCECRLAHLGSLLFLSLLGLPCCDCVFSSYVNGFYRAGSEVVVPKLGRSAACGIFQNQGSNPRPRIWGRILNHWALGKSGSFCRHTASTKLRTPVAKAWSLNHWTAREVSWQYFYRVNFI